jgi:hypothetical protein
MFARLEKVGKVQRFVVHSSHKEQKLEATVGQKNGRIDEGVASFGTEQKSIGWNATHAKM